MKAFKVVFLFLVQPMYSSAYAESNLPDFYQYPIQDIDIFNGTAAPIDLSSYPGAKKYSSKLTEGARKGPNFAGHYTAVTIGCGDDCQQTWIVDAKTGKILDHFLSSLSLSYQVDSTLMIINPPTPALANNYQKGNISYMQNIETAYKNWKKNKFETVYQDKVVNILGNHKEF